MHTYPYNLMGELLIQPSDPLPDPLDNPASVFTRRIEFHLARKPFTGFTTGSGDFKLETLNPSAKPVVSNRVNGSSGVVEKKQEVLENGLDPELNFRITIRRIGAGLENLGNTCFLNSVLQCLTYTEPLAAYLLNGRHQTSCRTAGFCALCAIQRHVSRALPSTGRILAPKELVANLRSLSKNFRNARQEDAHEYMVNLLESMHKCCLPSGVPTESASAYNKSLIHKIFGGRLRSQVKCMQCSFCSNKFDPFLDLSLEIAKADSLPKALAHFTAKEQLDGGERHYHCQQCKQKVKALKQLTIHTPPDVLAVHLKRFDSHIPGKKIDKKILFGSTLDLKPFVTGPYEGDLKYTLYAVLVHAGWSTHSGHYYCYISPSNGMWYSVNDCQVFQVNERKVLEQKAYMLFYSRDKRNFASKKPVDVHKEKMVANAIGKNNNLFSNFNQGLKETIRNGPIEKKFNDSNSAAAATSNAPFVGSMKENLIKKAPVQGINGFTVLNNNRGECLPQSVSSVKASNDSVKIDEVMSSTVEAKIINENRIQKDPTKSDVIPPNCNGTENSLAKKNLSDSNGKKASSLECTGKSLEKTDPVISVRGTSGDDIESGGESLGKKADDHVEETLKRSAELSSLPFTTSISSHKKAVDLKSHQKHKKKLLKVQITSMHLSSTIVFGKSLGKQKKKKHKRSKVGVKNLSEEHLVNGNCIPTDLGPSTSEKYTAVPPGGSTHSDRKGDKSGSKRKERSNAVKGVVENCNGVSSMVDKEVRERSGQNGADDLAQNSYREPLSSEDSKKDSTPINMLTRGLEEPVVARWDESEPHPYQRETNGAEGIKIGYVADDWDNEYDVGKRKKVKLIKNTFDGPNLFQEVANNNVNVKKGKTKHHSRYANQPHRI